MTRLTIDKTDSPVRGATRKSQVTRTLITTAALEVIAERGLAGTTHRAIAERAHVQLSMTTYHFRSLDDLLEAAFDQFVAQTHTRLEQFVALAEARVLPLLSGGMPSPAVRAEVIEQVAAMLTGYVCTAINERRIELAVECAFTFAWNPPPPLRDKVQHYNQTLVDLIAGPLALAGSVVPALDAEILTAAIRQLQFQHVTSGQEAEPEHVMALIRRLLERLLF